MYVSSKSISNPWLKAAYAFDGNLLNYGNTSGLGGTFDNGLTTKSKCRFSGYRSESVGGPIGINYEAHPTNLNYNTSPNPFPNNFYLSAPNLPIPDNIVVYDSIMVSDFPGTLTAIDVFVGIIHTYISDLTVTLIAPNGNQSVLLLRRGGAGKNLLTFFNDNYILTSTTAGYNPPWSSFLKPDNPMGTFGNTSVNGKWKIKIEDNQASDVGTLIEWGLRFNAQIGIKKIDSEIPKKFCLYQNYPNPFNPTTNIKFDLPKNLFVSLKIFDILGKEVSSLINSEITAGSYNIEWNASQYPSGVYFYKIETGNNTDTKKMLLIK
jgi:subtilisin-like proprotein convertase family protein